MANIDIHPTPPAAAPLRWRELWLKEDWWAIWLGLGIVVVALALFARGASIGWIAVTPPKWSSFAQLGAHFASSWPRYVVQFIAWLAVFSLALSALGTTFIGAALAAHASRLAAPWQRGLGVAGGGLLIAAGVANLAIADGSPILFVGLLGYAAWLVWLLVTGVRLVLMPRKFRAA